MSVVNKVLRDLENQPSATAQLDFLKADSSSQSHQAVKGVLIGGGLALVSYLIYQLILSPHNSLTETPPLLVAKSSSNQAQVAQSSSIEATQKKPVAATKMANNQQQTVALSSEASTPNQFNIPQQQPPVDNKVINEKAADLKQTATVVKAEKIQQQADQNQITKTKPKQGLANKQAEPIQRIKTTSQATNLQRELNRIKLNATNTNQQQTLTKLSLMLQNNPSFHPARLSLINLCWKVDTCLVEQKLQQALALFPKDTTYQQLLARFYFEKQRFQDAENLLSEIQASDTHYLQLLQTRALARQQLNKHQLAIEDYATLLAHDASRGDILLAVGISLDAMGKIPEAQRSFKNALTDRRLSSQQRQFALNKLNSYQG